MVEQNASWAELWFHYLESSGISAKGLERGRLFVERSHDLELDISAGMVEMSVRSGPRMTYVVNLSMPRTPEDSWTRLDEYIETRPDLLRSVGTNILPPEAFFTALEQSYGVFPNFDSCSLSCTCPAEGECKYRYAMLYFLGEHFEADPFELLRLLGRSRNDFLSSITATTTAETYQAELAEAAWQTKPPELPPIPEQDYRDYTLATWPSEPPKNKLFHAEGLTTLGEEAVQRARKLVAGNSTSELHLELVEDLARRASADLELCHDFATNSQFEADELRQRALAWAKAGAEGLDALLFQQTPVVNPEDQGFQLRQSRNGVWFRFEDKDGTLTLDSGPVDPPGDNASDGALQGASTGDDGS